jgi:hypothetical protein
VQKVAGGKGKIDVGLAGSVVVVERFNDLRMVREASLRRKGRKRQLAFLGGSMAVASFCGMLICTGLAESCFSFFRDRRNCE